MDTVAAVSFSRNQFLCFGWGTELVKVKSEELPEQNDATVCVPIVGGVLFVFIFFSPAAVAMPRGRVAECLVRGVDRALTPHGGNGGITRYVYGQMFYFLFYRMLSVDVTTPANRSVISTL